MVGSAIVALRAPGVIYKDCSHIQQVGKEDGLYEVLHFGIKKLVKCENGSTLIQERNPYDGFQDYFFDRSKEEYKQGFGYTGKEFWLGLNTIGQLIKNGNNVLRIEGVMQNSTPFWTEFKIEMNVPNSTFEDMNDGSFNIPFGFSNSPLDTYFSVTSATQLESSDDFGYSFVRPRIWHPPQPPGIDDNRIDVEVGFITTENEFNRTCPVKYHSSWWYPFQKNFQRNILCEFNSTFDTNLNGVFHHDQDQNQMRIFRYQKSFPIPDYYSYLHKNCLARWGYGHYYIYDNTCGHTVPLKGVKIFLKSN